MYSATGNGQLAFFSIWTGIDGWFSDATNDIMQTGIDGGCLTEPSFTIANYGAWYEFFPAASVYYSNLGVGQFDTISAVVQTGSFLEPGFFYPGAWFLVTLTRTSVGSGTVTTGSVKVPIDINTGIAGNSAEWIVERQTVSGIPNPPELADYGSMEMSNCMATMQGSDQIIQPDTQNSILITMTSDGTTTGAALSSPSFQAGPGEITFTWLRQK